MFIIAGHFFFFNIQMRRDLFMCALFLLTRSLYILLYCMYVCTVLRIGKRVVVEARSVSFEVVGWRFSRMVRVLFFSFLFLREGSEVDSELNINCFCFALLCLIRFLGSF